MDNNKAIPLMVPDIQESDIASVVDVLRSGMLIQGLKVEELEKSIELFLGVKNAIAVSNGTASLHLALIALEIGPGDEVIVPALSYIATANVVELVGATPIFVDINIDTFNIDVNLIETVITSKTKAIIPVHEFGLACEIEKVCSIASRHGLVVIEDAACALGATSNGKFVGSFGNIASFSFHPRKAITCGEGGILVTNDDLLAARIRVLRNHGIEYHNDQMNFVSAGFNYRLTDFQAAMVNNQLKRLHKILDYKNDLAKIYLEDLSNIDLIKLPNCFKEKNHTWQSFHIIVKKNRKELIEHFKKFGIGSNYGAQCIPAQQFYSEKYKLNIEELFPNALNAFENGLVLPLYEKMEKSDLKYVIKVLKAFVNA